tara:strand:- start:709 stop:987 length:279 start_codon:yes stop_codon:yes gene_type:complete
MKYSTNTPITVKITQQELWSDSVKGEGLEPEYYEDVQEFTWRELNTPIPTKSGGLMVHPILQYIMGTEFSLQENLNKTLANISKKIQLQEEN